MTRDFAVGSRDPREKAAHLHAWLDGGIIIIIISIRIIIIVQIVIFVKTVAIFHIFFIFLFHCYHFHFTIINIIIFFILSCREDHYQTLVYMLQWFCRFPSTEIPPATSQVPQTDVISRCRLIWYLLQYSFTLEKNYYRHPQ